MALELDEWQKEILKEEGNLVLCSGRQTGKSTIIAKLASDYATKNGSKTILVISSTERQADELFLKILWNITDNHKNMLKRGKDRATKHKLKLTNNSVVHSLPCGIDGRGVRGFTTDLLIVDEAAFVNDLVFSAITPQILTTGGRIILVSTPHGASGYFHECYNNPAFKVFHIKTEEIIKNRPISNSWTENQRTKALEHLEREKKTMSQREYLQEYAGIFISDLNQYFPDELIRRCMTLKRQERRSPTGRYYCGLDLARMGADLSVFSVIQKIDKDHLVQVESIATSKQLTTQTYNKLIELDRLWKFHQIYIDAGAGALGVVLFDFCLDNSQLKRKVVAINNRARPLDLEKAKSKILKEDLYNNLLNLMETKKIQLLDDEEIFLSLKSVQYEYVTKENQLTKLRIFGKYTHHAESIIRACCCTWDKTLNIWCR